LDLDEVSQVASILANLEKTSSKYGLLGKLEALAPGELDDLDKILSDWSVAVAKTALDELQTRLALLSQLDRKLRDESSSELHDLQPLFESSLWVFGPEFESIEYTSNRSMASVVRSLIDPNHRADFSRNRPDFVVIPTGSLGIYSKDRYGHDHDVCGVDGLVVVEIKRPGIVIASDEKSQAWKYVKELLQTGYIDERTKVHCFVLGSARDPTEGVRQEGNVVIEPMTYDVFIRRAEARMMNLRKKLANAPFLSGRLFTPIINDGPLVLQESFAE